MDENLAVERITVLNSVIELENSLKIMEGRLFGDSEKKDKMIDEPNIIDRICSSLERCQNMADHVGSQISRLGGISDG